MTPKRHFFENRLEKKSLFHRSKFQKSRSLRENEHFLKKNETRFWTKKQRYFHFEKSFAPENNTTTRIEHAESFNANPTALAVKVFEILPKNDIF